MTNRVLKNSGIQWIGDIPNSWNVEPIGKLFKERNIKVSDLDFPPLSVTKKGIVPQLENAAKSKNHNDRKQVKSGDFVINSRSDRKMSSGVSSLDGSVSLINIVLKSSSLFLGYTKYLLKNYGFAEEFYRWGTGIVADLWSTRYERMKKILIPYPSNEEQQKIAAFLDEKVEHIDNIIEDTKQSIENLKSYKQSLITETVTKGLDPNVEMKDSGIEWIGDIPKYWRTIKLKYLVKLRNEKRNYKIGDKYIGLENIESYSGKINSVQKDNNPGLTDFFRKGDILFNKLRPYLTKGFIADFDAFGSGELLVMKQYTGDKRFLLYYLLSSKFIDVINSSTYGAKMPRANWDFIKELAVINPTTEEQRQIADYLEEKTGTIDSTIKQKEQLIIELESYKKSLIYEYVTGKKEVN